MQSDLSLRKRLLFFSSILIILMVIILSDYAQKMIFTNGKNESKIDNKFNIEYKRGNIYDANGRDLAIDVKFYDVYVWTPNLDTEDKYIECANLLSEIFSLDTKTIYNKLKKSKGNLLVKKNLNAQELKDLREYKKHNKFSYLSIEEYYSRIYPQKNSGSILIGFTGIKNQGLEGLEYAYNRYLSPNNKLKNKRIVSGDNIYLTLDLNIQKYSDDVLDEMIKSYSTGNALITVMNAKTGEILSYSGYPNYDLNHFEDYSSEDRRNILTSKVYEPGSTFKIFSVAIAYENGKINDHTLINTEGGYKVRNGEVINDYSYRGITNPEGVIKYSSNVGAAYLSDTVSKNFFYDVLKKFGFGETTGFMPGEEKGLLKNPSNSKDWSIRTKATMSFGQEVGVTAIQMLAASTVFANNGDRLKPFIVKKIVDNNGKVLQEYKRIVAQEKVIKPSVTKKILSHMISTTTGGGTGRRVYIPGYKLAVKTGTAQVATPSGGYSKDRYLGSIISMLPGEDPQYIVYIFMDYPKGETLGGVTTSPSAKKIIQFLISYKDLSKNVQTMKQDLSFVPNDEKLPAITNKIPSYLGLSHRTILGLYKQDDIKLKIRGNGYVISQTPPAGTTFKKGMELLLLME